jgi:hypothetical protein
LKDISEEKEHNIKRYLMKYSAEEKSALLENLREILAHTNREWRQ